MHLYLSSYLIGDQGHNLANLAQGKTALVVSNELDFSNDSERLRSRIKREIGQLTDLGFPAVALDLRDYFVSLDILSEKLAAALNRIFHISVKTQIAIRDSPDSKGMANLAINAHL